MKSRTRSWILLIVTGLTLAALCGGPPATVAGGEEARSAETPAAAETETGAGPRVVVYYFHGERRCKTCRTIEAFAEETVRGRFGKQLGSGELDWQAVNFELSGNEHFVEEFGLVSSSLVVVEMRDGKPARFEVLQKAWSLVRDKPAFQQYVADAVRDYLG